MTATVVVTRRNIFGVPTSTVPSNYYTPGIGEPAVSTADYFGQGGMYGAKPNDMLAMGAEGIAIAAARQKRYVWFASANHPNFGYLRRDQDHFVVGFSDQPSELPKTFERIFYHGDTFGTPNHPGVNFGPYEFPWFLYYPEDVDDKPFYLFMESGSNHWTTIFRSDDMVTWVPYESSHYTATDAWHSFQRVFRRDDDTFFSIGLIDDVPTANEGIWEAGTDVTNFVSLDTAILGSPEVNPDASGRLYRIMDFDTVDGVYSAMGYEDNSVIDNNRYVSIFPVDDETFDKLDSPAVTHISAGYNDDDSFATSLNTYLHSVFFHKEDGLIHCWAAVGFASDVNTPAQQAGRAGAPNAAGGGLKQEFLDYYCVRYDDTAAAHAAPVGVTAACVDGIVTISWEDALPHSDYKVYRGTTYETQATLIDTVDGTETTDTPGVGRWFYKVVTVVGATPYGSRVVSVYAGDASAFVNEHINRVLEDGADPATVNLAFLKRADALLTSAGIRDLLQFWTHPAFGVNTDGDTIKVYDLGCTRLPRGRDYTAATTDTTIGTVNGGPAWVNANGTAYGYWGGERYNQIQKKRQITIAVAYERSQTSDDVTFVGTGPVWSDALDGSKILALRHTAGSPGNIEFTLCDEAGAKTATVAANGSGLQVAIGTFNGTNMLAYSNDTAGSANSGLYPNSEFGLGGPTGYAGTSTTTHTIAGFGSKTFTTQSGLRYGVGSYLRFTSVSDGSFMQGFVTAYSGTSLTAAMNSNGGAGTFSNWTINASGYIGGALAGSLNTASSGGFPEFLDIAGTIHHIIPFLGSGARHCRVLRNMSTHAHVRTFEEEEAEVKMQSVMILEGAIDATQVAEINTFLQSGVGRIFTCNFAA